MKAIKVDACGISCPGPIMKLKKSMEELADGERLEIVATDAGFPRDAEAWCHTTGNRFVSVKSGAGKYEVIVEKILRNLLPRRFAGRIKGKLLFCSVMTWTKF